MLSHAIKFCSSWIASFCAELLLRVRGSLLMVGTMVLLSSTGAWMYLGNSLTAYDMQRSARLMPSGLSPDVVVIGIDDVGYEQFFGGRSPLDKKRLVELFTAVTSAVPATTQLVVDLDMSPALGEDAAPLVAYWSQNTAKRWLIADPVLTPIDNNPVTSEWRQQVCDAGVQMAFPYLPSEFGYASGTHQLQGSFAHVIANGLTNCGQLQSQRSGWRVEDGRWILPRQVFPSSAAFVKNGLVLPFQGDLQQLQITLAQLKPKVVVIGGMWGTGDVFLTPFGERFGVQLHAAAMVGNIDKLHLAPYWLQFLTGLVCVAVLSIILSQIQQRLRNRVGKWGDRRLNNRLGPSGESLPGHVFFMQRLWPLFTTCMVFAALVLISEGLAYLQVGTGLWLPSSGVVYLVIGHLVFVWNWGLNQIPYYKTLREAWKALYINPIRNDWYSLKSGWLRLLNRPDAMSFVSSRRALIETLLSVASLSAQTLLPLTALYLAITKPL